MKNPPTPIEQHFARVRLRPARRRFLLPDDLSIAIGFGQWLPATVECLRHTALRSVVTPTALIRAIHVARPYAPRRRPVRLKPADGRYRSGQRRYWED